MRLPRFPYLPPWRGWPLALLCALYLLPGLIGHDPWKNDDALHFGITWELLRGGDWLTPHIVGTPWLETPPLYYWIAALCGHLFGGLLPLHDAIRLATGLYGALFLTLLAFASRLLHKATPQPDQTLNLLAPQARRLAGNAAPLIAIGCLGLLVPIHETQPLIALLAASATAYGGLALLPLRPLAGGLLAGLGIGLGFLASGLIALAHLLPLLLILPLNPHWRSRKALSGLLIAVLVTTLICLTWGLLLAWQRPALYPSWIEQLTSSLRFHTDGWRMLPDLLEMLAWFAWPALPLALWSLWLNRRHLGQPAISLPLIGALTSFIVLLLTGEPRPLAALPLLVPLILQAASSVHLLRRGATNAFDWFGMMSFTLFIGLVWLGGVALSFGIPAQVARNAAKLAPGFVAVFSPTAYAIALLLTITWLWLIFASPRSTWRGLSHWAAGVTLAWTLLITLWLPWIDYGKSYRSLASALQQSLPEKQDCIAARDLGITQRISLEYFANIRTMPADTPAGQACTLRLNQGTGQLEKAPKGWHKRWEGHRPSDRNERLRLYQKNRP
ncbi:MAG: glycosyltransferase family 39 protein [Sterolibacterium sp.]|jgi:4-amino-4-deoxy-L-arabinose transferase-like glycosyltransferase|nr:glycosyltransferase family 39 protein [Sterolibacterium sp.]